MNKQEGYEHRNETQKEDGDAQDPLGREIARNSMNEEGEFLIVSP